ncbi:MAG TPA: trimethylamine methyltransferase family protein [Ilumatobacteraceae bacterium]|nr:trimethylamine methyltransferase family protein [Ilumatobacteraceae bacterium]
MTGAPARHRTGGGRSARMASRTGEAAKPHAPAFIRRAIPPYELLSEEGLALIESQADRLLAEVGMEIRDDAESLRLFRDAGASVDGVTVRFDAGHVRALCGTAPRQFRQLARNPSKSVEIGGDNVVFAPTYGSPFVRDLAAGRRYASLADFHNFVRLAYDSPWLHHSGGTVCEPVDVPVNKRHLDMVYAHLRYSDKAFMGSVTHPSRAADSIEMARIVFGADVVDGNCVILGNVNVNSPLVWDATMTGALKTYAAANQAPVVVPFILGGAMGPVTTAGAVAQAHAETLVGIALGQLVRPGSPAIYGNFLSSMALRSGSPTFGTPEPALGSLVVGQLARRVGLPLRCSGAFTSAKIPDGQAMSESAVSMLSALLCGANFILHAAGWLEGGLTMGYEKFMMDLDLCGAAHTYLKGMDLSADEFALDAFAEIGPGKHFFSAQHTLRHYETAFYDPALSDSSSYEQWRDAGELRTEDRAAARYREILANYEAPLIDDAVDAALLDFVARRKASMPDQWY